MTEPRHRLGKRPPIWALPRDRTVELAFPDTGSVTTQLAAATRHCVIMTRWRRGPLCSRVVLRWRCYFNCLSGSSRNTVLTEQTPTPERIPGSGEQQPNSDGQHSLSMGFKSLCVAANLRTHRNLTVVTYNVAMWSVLPAEAPQGVFSYAVSAFPTAAKYLQPADGNGVPRESLSTPIA
jgi:hypothetical protein